ncbi:MAG: hypothetical protein Harvfovirus6_7 [Harvfovirus sp.]|uniref:Uncharacterized protein n=1 Tax=Harvfovirus sp. TaxID=2487768 RepID=A0A3G5A0P0_9VIRU|nr:MAG: hypothetical protein Harvfovirus6_7 [Harvfovirus sp.]
MGLAICSDRKAIPVEDIPAVETKEDYIQLNHLKNSRKNFFVYKHKIQIKGLYIVYLDIQFLEDICYGDCRITNKFVYKFLIIHCYTQNVLILNDEKEILFKLEHVWDGKLSGLIKKLPNSSSSLKEFDEIYALIIKPDYISAQLNSREPLTKSPVGTDNVMLPNCVESGTTLIDKDIEIKFQYETVSEIKSRFHIYSNVKFDENIFFNRGISNLFTYRFMLINRITSNFLLFNELEEKILLLIIENPKPKIYTPKIINLRDEPDHDLKQFEDVVDQIIYGPNSLLAKKTSISFESGVKKLDKIE